MSDTAALTYQTTVGVGGQLLTCLESYDSLHERLREGTLRMADNDDGSGQMRWMPPIEVTVAGEAGRPIRCLIQPMAVGFVWEIPEADRPTVEIPSNGH